MKKVMIAGTFDNFHVGHQYLIAQALERGTELVIIVARDKTVERIKGCEPKHTEEQRKSAIENLYLSPFTTYHSLLTVRLGREDADFLQTLREESPNILLLGYDQHFNSSVLSDDFAALQVQTAAPYKPEVFKSSKFNL